jgi:branched-chain amino acid transport system ATP-binding protein
MVSALDAIRAEHKDLDRVLTVLAAGVDALSDDGPRPNLELLAAAVYYVRVFPERYHHPKEEAHLFKALRRRRPESAGLLDRLEAQHAEGEGLTAALGAALEALDRDDPEGLAALKRATEHFVAFQRRHIGLEEREVLPLAEQCLDQADWREIDQAFARNSDPLFADNLQSGFRALHARITGG